MQLWQPSSDTYQLLAREQLQHPITEINLVCEFRISMYLSLPHISTINRLEQANTILGSPMK